MDAAGPVPEVLVDRRVVRGEQDQTVVAAAAHAVDGTEQSLLSPWGQLLAVRLLELIENDDEILLHSIEDDLQWDGVAHHEDGNVHLFDQLV